MPMVLIIDDEPVQSSSARGVLGDALYDYGTATSGAEARAFLQSRGHDVDAYVEPGNEVRVFIPLENRPRTMIRSA